MLTVLFSCQGRDGTPGRAGKRGERGATVTLLAAYDYLSMFIVGVN